MTLSIRPMSTRRFWRASLRSGAPLWPSGLEGAGSCSPLTAGPAGTGSGGAETTFGGSATEAGTGSGGTSTALPFPDACASASASAARSGPVSSETPSSCFTCPMRTRRVSTLCKTTSMRRFDRTISPSRSFLRMLSEAWATSTTCWKPRKPAAPFSVWRQRKMSLRISWSSPFVSRSTKRGSIRSIDSSASVTKSETISFISASISTPGYFPALAKIFSIFSLRTSAVNGFTT